MRRDAERAHATPLSVRVGAAVLGIVLASAAGHALARGADPGPAAAGAVERVDAALSTSRAPVAGAPLSVRPGSREWGLQPCRDLTDCYEWVVAPGDTVASIASALGRPITSVLALNPHIHGPGDLRVGDRVRVPPPGN